MCVSQREGVGGVELLGHLYVQDRAGQAAQSIASPSGPPVSGPCVALRIFATLRQFMDPARRLYTHTHTHAHKHTRSMSRVSVHILSTLAICSLAYNATRVSLHRWPFEEFTKQDASMSIAA